MSCYSWCFDRIPWTIFVSVSIVVKPLKFDVSSAFCGRWLYLDIPARKIRSRFGWRWQSVGGGRIYHHMQSARRHYVALHNDSVLDAICSE